MRKPPLFRILHWLLLMTVFPTFQSCKQDVKEPIDRFQKSTALATVAISGYYKELNPYEREIYLQNILFDTTKQVLRMEGGVPTPLKKDPFDQKVIQARLAMIKQLANYAEKLSTLAGNDAPQRFTTNVTTLASSLTSLSGTFSQLTSSGDASANDYVGPISTLVGVLGNVIIQKRRDVALRTAIINGDAPFTRILDFLERDLDKYVSDLRKVGDDQKQANIEAFYNHHKAKLSLEQRRELLKELNQAAEVKRITFSTKPSDVVKAMRQTHKALVSTANSPTIMNTGLILSTIDNYENQVQTLIDAVLQLKENHKQN
ncbi:hypothetical protein BN8_05141 [Fibrisoma limi BUZ 3]|uniref:Lipoprotein n=1 Tax=Fibrisoma limi BUZ 3 TaxID=1185876 RepID=I2GPM2_9BACT|nr:hypothetical protein [Fibrisoma limi]CCH55850.1 hypothetical protein BN8_05141 [Fibrisoma limi BUZ 3]